MKTTASSIFLMTLLSAASADDECPDKVSLTTMAKGGQYASSSSSQQESYRQLFPDIARAVQASLTNDQSTLIALADYGAADGLATRYILEFITDNIPDVKIDVMTNVNFATPLMFDEYFLKKIETGEDTPRISFS